MPPIRGTRLFLRPCSAAVLALAIGTPAGAGGLSPPVYDLLPLSYSTQSLSLPGERRENRLSGERALMLRPGVQWLTTTSLSRALIDQPYPVRTQSLSLSTGPQIMLGETEMSLRLNAGREASSLGTISVWNGGAPRMTVALGPNDRVRLEAAINTRNEANAVRRKRTASVSWRHRFSDRWSLTAGLRQARESDALEDNSVAETYASVDAWLRNGWLWSVASSLKDSSYGGAGAISGELLRRDRSASLSLSTRYQLYGGWWISGELRSTQVWVEADPPTRNQYGGVRLSKNF